MKKVLVCWIGNTDLKAQTEEKDIGLGPIGQSVAHTEYDEIALVSNYGDTINSKYVSWLESRTKAKIFIYPEKLSGPTQFGEIYEATVRTVLDIQHRNANSAELTFHLSPGTPAMCCHETGADLLLAWPTAEFAMLGSKAAVPILYKKEIEAAADPEKVRQEKITEYKETILSPYYSASKQYIDEVIRPADTRRWLIWGLELFEKKESEPRDWKKHGNIPL